MPAVRHLSNAPIAEAIISIQVKQRASFDPESILSAADVFPSDFPEVNQGKLIQFETEGKETGVVDHGYQALKAISADERRVVQFRADGFTFSRLRPYETWETLYEEAIELWRLYVSVIDPEAVIRLTVRFLNHITIPLGSDLDDYLTAGPKLPRELPQSLAHFLINVEVPIEEDNCMVSITQAAERELEDNLRLVLDIEAFKPVDLEPMDGSIQGILFRLRDLKNRFFFNLVTETALERYS